MNAPNDAPRQGRKVEQVLAGARTVFLRDGFEGASVDAIAREAGVSKATLYSYFADKRVLFMAVGHGECRRQSGQIMSDIDREAPPHEVLTEIGRRILWFMCSDLGQRLFRMCVAEAERFPELGRQFWETGHVVVRGHIVAYLEGAVARGALAPIEDLDFAAEQFFELCKVDLFSRMMCGCGGPPSEAERERVIEGAVDMFLARHGARPRPDASRGRGDAGGTVSPI